MKLFIDIYLLLLVVGWIRETESDGDDTTTKENTIDANKMKNNKNNTNVQFKYFSLDC